MEIKDEIYLFLGPKLVEKFHPLLVDLLRKQKAGDHEILNELKKSTGQGAKDKARTIEQKWQRIEQVIKCRLNAEI